MSALILVAMALAIDLPAEASREVLRGECKAVDRDEILVCGNRGRDERFRLPDRSKDPFDPFGDTKSVPTRRW